MALSVLERLREWFHTHLTGPLKQMTGWERFLLLFFGFWFGVFPIPGLSTSLLLFSFLVINRKLNDPFSVSETTVAMAVNVLSTPFCIALMPFWMRLGTTMLNTGLTCKASRIIDEFSKSGFFEAISKFAACLGAGTFAWLVTSVAIVPCILILRSKIKQRFINPDRITEGQFSVLGVDDQQDLIEAGMINVDQESEMNRIPISRRNSGQ